MDLYDVDYESNMDIYQIRALNAIKSGRNVFITGGAGSGKSFLIQYLFKHYGMVKDIELTSLTGVSARLIGGTTIHSFAGIYSVEYGVPLEKYYEGIKKKSHIKRRIKNTDILVIDEVSMMDYYMLDVLDYIFKKVRNNLFPFGGIQVVMVGDFFQLPPVSQVEKDSKIYKYVFQNPLWNTLINDIFILERIHRQNENLFIKILNKVRIGEIDKEVIEYLNKFMIEPSEIHSDEMADYPKLYSRRIDNDSYNLRRLKELEGEELLYNAKILDSSNTLIHEDMNFPNLNIDTKLKLKIGSVVMVCSNIDKDNGIVNGSIGKIIRFDGKKIKDDELKDDESKYIKTIDKFNLLNLKDTSKDTSKDSIIEEKEYETRIPIVELMDGKFYRAEPIKFLMDKYTIIQVPLKLAWSLTIHKSQGASINKVCIDIGKSIFEYGQAYVALSRCTNTKHLKIMKMDPKSIRADPSVIEFYDKYRKGKNILSEEETEEWDDIKKMIDELEGKGEIEIGGKTYDIDNNYFVYEVNKLKRIGKLWYEKPKLIIRDFTL